MIARRTCWSRVACLAVAGAWLALTPAHAAMIAQAGTVEILFTPGDAIDKRLVAAIAEAHEAIHVLAYAFTDRSIARALVAAHTRGVHVEVVADRAQAQELAHTVLTDLDRHGVGVWLDAPQGSAHNKVLIIDPDSASPVTITGSFNLTRAAQLHNAENVVIFHGNGEVAQVYERYYQARRAGAVPWPRATQPPRADTPGRSNAPECRPGEDSGTLCERVRPRRL